MYGRGRICPGIRTEENKLNLLVQCNCTKKQMADTLGVSVSTVKRRLRHFGLKLNVYDDINDEDLKERVTNLNRLFPNSGYREMWSMLQKGSLNQLPIKVQRHRVAKVLREVDRDGTERRLSRAIQRRVYRVPRANSLWHIDTHHKLIRWNFVIAGCIDGFSRLISYLTVAPDNKATTSFTSYLSAIHKYGIPRRCRADDGGENNLIKRFQRFIFNSADSFITGPSVHNQRIERLWRDVQTKVLSPFRMIFYALEDCGSLDADKDEHITALHIAFLQTIQFRLDTWCEAHNNHSIRTEQNRTPLQMWTLSSLSPDNQTSTEHSMAFSTEIGHQITRFQREASRYMTSDMTSADEESAIHIHTRDINSDLITDAMKVRIHRLTRPSHSATDEELAAFYRSIRNILCA